MPDTLEAMAALAHAILQRDLVEDARLFVLQRQPPRVRTPSPRQPSPLRPPPNIQSPVPMDMDMDEEEEEEKEEESQFERDTRHLLDEYFADSPPRLARAGPSISRRDAVQSLDDDDYALMHEPVQSRNASNASIDSDFSMSLELRQNSSDEGEDDPAPPASAAAAAASSSSSAAVSQGTRQNSLGSETPEVSRASTPILPQSPPNFDYDPHPPTPPASAPAVAAASSSSSAAASQGSEVGEIIWDSQSILDQDWGSMDPTPFVPPILPPLETKEQTEARERAELEARHAKLASIAEQHAVVVRQQQIRILREREEKAAVIERADPANPAVIRQIWNMSPDLVQEFLATNKSKELSHSGIFCFMTPRVYTKNFQFHPLKKYVWSIKLDGNRALWDGFRRVLQSKSRRVTVRPEGFWADLLPKNCYLDGELVVPASNRVNGTATEFASLLHEVSPLWQVHPFTQQTKAYRIWDNLQFHAFDIVGADLNDKPLQHRLGVLESTLRQFGLTPENPVLKRVHVGFLETNARIPGTNMREMHEEVAVLLAHYARLGAEGLVIKDYASTYEHRTDNPSIGWLKVKHYEDTEARVVGFYPATSFSEKGVRIQVPDETKPPQGVPYANSNLIRFDLLKIGDIVHVAYMPVAPRPGAVKLRTPIIRSVIQDGTTWEEIKQRYRQKEQEARGSS